MRVSELIFELMQHNPNAVVVIERDDDYWHVADVDTARLKDVDAKSPVWDYDTETTSANAVRICV